MAAGMSKGQLASMEGALSQAYAQAMASGKTRNTVSNLGATVTLSADSRYTCASGGYIHSTMTLRTIVTANNGNATISGSGHQTIADWRCVKGWIVNGDPYVSHTISSSYFAGTFRMSVYMSGGWKATGTNKAKQSCQTTANSQYSTIGNSGVTTVHIRCVPGGSTDITTRF